MSAAGHSFSVRAHDEGMPQTERSAFSALTLETSFQRSPRTRWPSEDEGRDTANGGKDIANGRATISRNSGAYRRRTHEDNVSWNDLHAATQPILVPRHNEPAQDAEIEYPHNPDDVVAASPLNSFLQSRQTSISFSPTVTLECGRHHALEQPMTKLDIHDPGLYKPQPQTSGLRNALSQESNEVDNTQATPWSFSPRRMQNNRGFLLGSRSVPLNSPEDDLPGASYLYRVGSLTSLSAASPIFEEPRTPSEGAKEMLLSPCVVSPVHSSTFSDERSSWSTGAITPFGSKSRSSALERNRASTRQSSRRSTGSSGKSPASTFLSMWSGGEEPVAKPDDEGQMVGTEYVIGKEIGFGGFSTVKEAFKLDESHEPRRLAVKIVKKHISGRSEKENDQVQAEFDHEVRVWRYLNHPHVLALDAVYETDYATFCFTKLAIGGTLFDLVRQNRQGLDLKLAKKYTYQLACALRYLHEDVRVIHRDIKLENCLLDPVENPDGSKSSNLVLCDFGMAEWINNDNAVGSPDPYDDVTDRPPPKNIGPADSSTSVAGSLEYASPELLQSTCGIIHPTVDIWAYGVIVFAVVVGSRPFQDPFSPRIRSNIVSGMWNRSAVLGDSEDSEVRQSRMDALELIEGCLEIDVDKRWTIRQILASRWLRDQSERAGDSTDTSWKL